MLVGLAIGLEDGLSSGSFESCDKSVHLLRPMCYGGQMRLDGGIRCIHGASVGVDTAEQQVGGLVTMRRNLGDAVQ